jgi:ribosomal-protein-alanine N-acetyltransferase
VSYIPGEASSKAEDVMVRRILPSDVPAVLGILEESPEAAAWSGDSLVQAVSTRIAWVAVHGEEVRGFLIGQIAAGEFEILNLAVAPRYRCQGVGSKLVEAALEFSRHAGGSRAYLEVRASNTSAITLYARHGFMECGRRPRYYHSPEEDAVLLFVDLDVTR